MVAGQVSNLHHIYKLKLHQANKRRPPPLFQPHNLCAHNVNKITDVYRTSAKSNMKTFEAKVTKAKTFVTKISILDSAVVLDTSLKI